MRSDDSPFARSTFSYVIGGMRGDGCSGMTTIDGMY